MPLSPIFEPVSLAGHILPNRMMLASLTNQSSHENGVVSADEQRWLAMRATGGFGLVSTAAGTVSADGKAFPGQLGFHSDAHLPGLTSLAQAIRDAGGVSMAQLLHGGGRAPAILTGVLPVAPSAGDGARALAAEELPRIIDQFVSAALRAEQAGFDGVQIHAAYGFLLAQFLNPAANRRTDGYGGDMAGRTRLVREIIAAVRSKLSARTFLSLRLNLIDRGLPRDEVVQFASELLRSRAVDHVDIVRDYVLDLKWVSAIDRGTGLLSITGGLATLRKMEQALAAGADLIGIGTAGVLHHDLPHRLLADPAQPTTWLPASPEHLRAEGAAAPFLSYLGSLPGFVAAPSLAA